MSETREFLGAVLPEDGTYCVAGLPPRDANNKHLLTQHFVGTIDDLIRKSDAFVADGWNAFYAMASFNANKRQQRHVQWLKSFWLDIDCGEDKPYPDHQAARTALDAFVTQAQLPAPTIINSGYGYHVYWVLSCSVSRDVWQPVADLLDAACTHFKLHIDVGLTPDSARILRIPDTINVKDPDNPRAVVVEQRPMPVDFEFFHAALGMLGLDPKPRKKTRAPIPVETLSETAKALLGNQVSSFSKIARLSLQGQGCATIRHIITDQEEISEPLWRGGLSVAWVCEDRDTAIHRMSSKYAGYVPNETLYKAQGTVGPYTCKTFRSLDGNQCEGCTQQITSPVQLGRIIKRAEPVVEAQASEAQASEPADSDDDAPKYTPPHPYFRGAHGGVYREDNDGIEKTEVKIYDYDLYPVKRIQDPNDGESIVFKLHLPQDGVREFTVPLKRLMATDSFRDIFGGEGVAATPTQMRDIMQYTIKYAQELQRLHRAHQARLQFGWTDNLKAFVVGNRTYTKKRIEHNPASSTTADYLRHMNPRGELAEWREAFNVIARPGMEPLQFAALSAFGAPLMRFTGHAGATINLISNESGTGKSTAGQLALSVFGDPMTTGLVEQDTHMAKLHHLGVFNNLVVMSDEMTNMAPDVASSLIYAISQGRARHRMERDANQLRKNLSSWSTILLTNSNASIMSKLSKSKARPDGELMRLIELHVDRVYVDGADELFAKMNHNYGVAGEVYAPWLVHNAHRLPEVIDKQRKQIYDAVGKQMHERFWTTVAAVNQIGGLIAQNLGLHDFDLKNLRSWICDDLMQRRTLVVDEILQADNLIGEYLLENISAVLVIGNRINPVTGDNATMPRGHRLAARLEVQNNRMFIAKKPFRDYCVNRQFTEQEALKTSRSPDAPFRYTKTIKKRMFAGTHITAPGVDAHVFECSPEETEKLFDAIESKKGEAQGGT